jgi:hypothetical protein
MAVPCRFLRLSKIGLRGIQSNPESAAHWYRLARDLGDGQAAALLLDIENHTQRASQ